LALYLPWQQPAFAAESGLWQRDDQRQYAQMRRGVEAYRSGDYAAAEAALRDLPGADAAYNRGNALAKQGRYEEAITEYDRALKLQPSMRDAQVNRGRVEAARKPSQKPQQQPKDKPKDPAQDKPDDSAKDKPQDKPGDPAKDKPQDKPDDSAKDKPQDKPGDPAKDKPKDPAQGKPQDRQNGGQPNPPPQQKPPQQNQDPADRKAQEQAQREAEQRERMRRAQEKQSEQKGPGDVPDKPLQPLYPASPGPAPANESAQARERRIANEVWLQRVPDDPGGLLRAKFKLENQRRRRGKDR
jgi:Ca-activated chloride channel homolog